jgi:hypothetical protein
MSTSPPKGPLRALGNYSTTPAQRIERRLAMVIRYQGQRAHIRLHDGKAYGMPSAPLMQVGIPEGGRFVIVTTWVGKTPIESRVEAAPEARPPSDRRSMTPKVVVRDGRKMITRQPVRRPTTAPRRPE